MLKKNIDKEEESKEKMKKENKTEEGEKVEKRVLKENEKEIIKTKCICPFII